MNNEREFSVIYKGVTINCVRGSNWVYINGRPFEGLHSAKIWITKHGT